MSREIKFRGLDSMTGSWVYGNLIILGSGSKYIIPQNLIGNEMPQWLVDRDTVCQYTGLKDKNGNEIYEGDILKIPVDIVDSFHGDYSFHEVVYRNGTWVHQYLQSETGFRLPRGYTAGVLVDNYDHDMKTLLFNEYALNRTEIEVIGNIYENPELLEANSDE